MSAAAGRHVLIVDDFADNREMYAEFLAFCGYRVSQAATGQEAIDVALTDPPDVIVMDLALPGVDGWEATRRLKADGRTRAIPVIALTGHALVEHAQTAERAGCDRFVTKPCLPEALLAAIEEILQPAGQKTGSQR